jgi:N4-gp56 family major capsid protein
MAISNFSAQVWSARILAKLEKTLIYGQEGVVNREYEGEIREYGDRVHIHSFNDLTISTYTKNSTTVSYEELTDSRVTLLIDQSKYFAFKVDDVDAAQMKPKVVDAASRRAAYQLAETADRYIASLYSGASTSNPDNTVETTQATSSNIYGKIVNLAALMDGVNLPQEGRYLVVPPWVKALLLQNSDFLNATNATDGDGAALNGEVGRVAGIRILVSNNVPTTGTSPVVSHCQAGHASGLGYAEQIRSVEAIRLEGAFADGIRGLHLYGAKVLDGARLFDLQLNP